MLAAIGETLETPSADKRPPPSSEEEMVTGVILQARANFYRISVWTRRADAPLVSWASFQSRTRPART